MGLEQLYTSSSRSDDFTYVRVPNRRELLNRIYKRHRVDLVIAGGGLYGVCLAREAAFNGLSVLYATHKDYEIDDPNVVWDRHHHLRGIRGVITVLRLWECFKTWSEALPHLVDCASLRIPVSRPGAMVCSVLHRIAGKSIRLEITQDENYFEYQYPHLNSKRAFYECVVSALKEGAVCLNHVSVKKETHKSYAARLEVTDNFTERSTRLTAGIFVEFQSADKILEQENSRHTLKTKLIDHSMLVWPRSSLYALSDAHRILRKIYRLASMRKSPVSIACRPIGGACGRERVQAFFYHCRELGVPEEVITRVFRTWGGRVLRFQDCADGCQLIGGTLLKGELRCAVEEEQAQSLGEVEARLGIQCASDEAQQVLSDMCQVKQGRREPS